MDGWTGEPNLILDAEAPGGRTGRNEHCARDLWANAVHGTEDRGPCVPCSPARPAGGLAAARWIVALVCARELQEHHSRWTAVHAGGTEGGDEVGP